MAASVIRIGSYFDNTLIYFAALLHVHIHQDVPYIRGVEALRAGGVYQSQYVIYVTGWDKAFTAVHVSIHLKIYIQLPLSVIVYGARIQLHSVAIRVERSRWPAGT